jgi:putative serine protease PepD
VTTDGGADPNAPDSPEREVQQGSGPDATTGWWSREGPTPSAPRGPGAAVPPQTADPRWSWELPTDSIGHRGRWASVRVALPIVFGLVIIIALLAGALGAAIGISSERHHDGTSGPPVDASSLPTAPPLRGAAQGSLASVAARVLPSVVEVDVSAGSAKDTGSGFVIARAGSGGYILTNNHVISLAATQHGSVRVVFQNGNTVVAHIRGRATTYDLAVLRVDNVSNLVPATLGDSNQIAVGDPVIAIGSPLGLAGTVTSGIVSAVNRPVAANGEGTDTNAVIDAIQTDAAINPGNSGGPLVDSRGSVIGVNSAIATLSSGSSNPFGSQDQAGSIGLGFAIPVDSARDTATQIINKGFAVRPIIGVTLDPLYDGSPAGALIGCPPNAAHCTAITANGPAAKAGLRAGDVIVSVDGQRTPSGDEVVVLTRKKKPGDTLRIEVVRDGQHKTFTVKLGQARA